MITFHEYLIFFLIQVGVIVCFFLWENNQRLKAEKFTHESFIEIIWTFLPAIILLFIAVPSFILLYSLDDVLNPTVTIKVVAHQWYWSYEYVDYVTNPMTDPFCGELTFDSYLVSTADIIEGSFRLLEVDQRLVVPTHTHVRLLICSGDVLHSWAVPATGVKLDACPGRISEVNLFLKRSGVYYGQCSEICGTNHGFMPIVVEAVSPYAFYNWLHSKVMNASISATSLTLPEECLTWTDPVIAAANLFSLKTFCVTKNKIFAFISSHLINYNTPSSLNYIWSFGAMAGLVLVFMIITGTLLAMHYTPTASLAFDQVDLITIDVAFGWFFQSAHANGASVFFIVVYVHILKALFFGSYHGERRFVWYIGLIIFILMMATGFIGYVLPWGQMSLWGATVITNLFSSIPAVGQPIVIWLWSGYSVSAPTLLKFFALHFTLPYVIVACVFAHLAALHSVGSNNPTGVDNVSTISFAPFFIIKDILAFFITLIFLATLIFLFPGELGHPDNSIKANPLVTPAHIVPEWYFLPFYAILRSIPNKSGGIIAMGSAILALFTLPSIKSNCLRSSSFRPFFSFLLILWVLNVLFLGWIGQLPVEAPYVHLGLHATVFYFLWFLLFIPISSVFEKLCAYFK